MMTMTQDYGDSRAGAQESKRAGDQPEGEPGPSTEIDYRPIFASALCAMLLADQAGRITQTNSRLDAMFGYAAGELDGQPSEVLFPERHREMHEGMRDVYHARPQRRVIGFDNDLTGRRKDGEEFPLEIELCSVTAPEGVQSCAMIVDLTERNRSALRLREADAMFDQIAQAISRDMLDQIHDVATQVALSAESHEGEIPADVRRNLRRLSGCLSDVEHLMNELVIYSQARHFPMKTETIDLGAVIDEAIAREAPGAGVSIDVAVPRETFLGARIALSGVLRSLLSNAIKHHDREEMKITARARFDGDWCLIDFCDDGPGIPEAARQRVFRLFDRLTGSIDHGSGMGLAIAQRLAEGHGASISLASRDGERGCHFRVCWPRYLRSDRA